MPEARTAPVDYPLGPPAREIRQRLVAQNTVLNIAAQTAPMLLALVTIPFVIRGFGVERFGVLSVIWAVINYFTLFDFGLGRAVTNFVAQALATGDEFGAASLIWTASLTQALLGTLGALGLLAASGALVRYAHIQPALSGEARMAYQLSALAVPVFLVASALRGALEAAQRFDLANLVKIPVVAATFLAPAIAVALHGKLATTMLLLLLIRGLGVIATIWMCVRVFPELRRAPTFHRAHLRKLMNFGSWVMGSGAIGPTLAYFDRFLIATFVTMSAVSYYAVPYEMVTRLWVIPVSLASTLFPAFSVWNALGRRTSLERSLTRSMKWILIGVGPIAVMLAVFAHDLLRTWLGPSFAEHSSLILQLLAVGLMFNSLSYVPIAYCQAAGKADLIAKLQLLELPFYVATAYVLTRAWGVHGVAAAWTMRSIVDCLLMFAAASRTAQANLTEIIERRLLWTTVTLLFFGCACALVSGLNVMAPYRLLSVASATLLAAAAIWHKSLDDSDRWQLANLISRNPRATK